MCPPTIRIRNSSKPCQKIGQCRGKCANATFLTTLNRPNPVSISLLLGGGGAKAAAHLGVLNVLDRAGLPIRSVYGSSAGALVALFYCAGYHPRELQEMMRSELNPGRPWKWVPGMGLARLAYYLRWGGLRRLIRRHIRFRNVEELPKALTVMTSDLNSRRGYAIRTGCIETAILASMSLPGLGRPVRHHGRWLVDGSFMNDLPVDLARAESSPVVIAVDLNDTSSSPETTSRPSAWSGIFLPMFELSRRQAECADFVIRPKFQTTDWTDFSNLDEFVSRGESATHRIVSQVVSRCGAPIRSTIVREELSCGVILQNP